MTPGTTAPIASRRWRGPAYRAAGTWAASTGWLSRIAFRKTCNSRRKPDSAAVRQPAAGSYRTLTVELIVDALNRNEPVHGYRTTFAIGEHEYWPRDVADLVMHGSIFHRKDRGKTKILQDVDPWMPTMIELIFKSYVVDITEAADLTRLVLLKEQGKSAISDDAIDDEARPGERV